MTAPTFYLGTHMPHWLATPGAPLFVSHRRLAGRQTMPVVATDWALDSGGFTELSMFGGWRTTPAEYLAAVRRYDSDRMRWAAPQDWMCEPFMLAKTGLTILEHQQQTVANYVDLRRRWDPDESDCPFVPVLQGWTLLDYLRCADLYEQAGVHLSDAFLVGLGSVCRRQDTGEIHEIVAALAELDIDLHGFGVKTDGLARYGHLLTSADSLAWSYAGRRTPGCAPTHRNEANCRRFALAWRNTVLDRIDRAQPTLWEAS